MNVNGENIIDINVSICIILFILNDVYDLKFFCILFVIFWVVWMILCCLIKWLLICWMYSECLLFIIKLLFCFIVLISFCIGNSICFILIKFECNLKILFMIILLKWLFIWWFLKW